MVVTCFDGPLLIVLPSGGNFYPLQSNEKTLQLYTHNLIMPKGDKVIVIRSSNEEDTLGVQNQPIPPMLVMSTQKLAHKRI